MTNRMISALAGTIAATFVFTLIVAAPVVRAYLPQVRHGTIAPDRTPGDITEMPVPPDYVLFAGADISVYELPDDALLWCMTARRPDGTFGVVLFHQAGSVVTRVPLPVDSPARGQLVDIDGLPFVALWRTDPARPVLVRVRLDGQATTWSTKPPVVVWW